jgi:hypothetical protein
MSWLVKTAGAKLLSDKFADKFAAEDPYYENVEVEARPGKKTKKQVKRELPQGLSTNDDRILRKMRRKAYCLDLVFKLCGCRAGWSAIIGFIPVVGDIINIWLGMSLIHLAERIDGGLPASVRSRMVSNVVIDFVLGFTPVLGSIAGAVYKSNSRNYLILEQYLRTKYRDNNPARPSNGNGPASASTSTAHANGSPPRLPERTNVPPQSNSNIRLEQYGQESGTVG